MISPDLAGLTVPIGDVQLLPGNPRRGDVDAVARSLDRFGQRKPIVVQRSDKSVLAGNHTLQAARSLGWSEIAVVWVDDDDTTGRAYALADNRTADLAGYDSAALAELLEALDGDLEGTGYTEADIEKLISASADEEPPEFPEYGEDIETEHRCPKCGYEWSGKSN